MEQDRGCEWQKKGNWGQRYIVALRHGEEVILGLWLEAGPAATSHNAVAMIRRPGLWATRSSLLHHSKDDLEVML